MRLSDDNLANAKAQKARLEKLYGTEVSRSQAIESLMTVGALAWEAVERTGSWSPGALIEAGEREQAAAKAIMDEHLARTKQERAARIEQERLARTGAEEEEHK